MLFFVTQNALSFSQQAREQFHLLKWFGFRESPRRFSLTGKLQDQCKLPQVTYRASCLLVDRKPESLRFPRYRLSNGGCWLMQPTASSPLRRVKQKRGVAVNDSLTATPRLFF
jgi:hypothetical protein